MNIQTGKLKEGGIVCVCVCAYCRKPPRLPPELPKLISRQHPKPITAEAAFYNKATSPPFGAATAKAK